MKDNLANATTEEIDDRIDELDRVMDATQTLLHLEPGHVLTKSEIDELLLLDKYYRDDQETATNLFHRGYESGLARGAGADTAKLIEERDSARGCASIANALRTSGERWAFLKGATVCREMMARFVEQGGTETERNIATSIRANWRPSWGDDPGAPSDEVYTEAVPCEISARDTLAREVLECLWQYESDLLHPPTDEDSRLRRIERIRKVIAKTTAEPVPA